MRNFSVSTVMLKVDETFLPSIHHVMVISVSNITVLFSGYYFLGLFNSNHLSPAPTRFTLVFQILFPTKSWGSLKYIPRAWLFVNLSIHALRNVLHPVFRVVSLAFSDFYLQTTLFSYSTEPFQDHIVNANNDWQEAFGLIRISKPIMPKLPPTRISTR